MRERFQVKRGVRLHKIRNGAITSAPAASPSHQVSQISEVPAGRASPPRIRTPTPIVALTAVASRPASPAKRKMFLGESRTRPSETKRRTSHAPSRASVVLPIAIPAEVSGLPVVVRLTRNAAIPMPGHTRGPKIRHAASAIPVGGQTAVALGFTCARPNPSRPARKYATAMAAIPTGVRNVRTVIVRLI